MDAAKRKPDDAKAQSDAAVMLDATGDRNHARELIEKAEQLSPQDATIAYNHARILYELGRIDEALARLEKA